MSGLACIFTLLVIGLLGMSGAYGLAVRRYRRAEGAVATTAARLHIERHKSRTIQFGPEYHGDLSSGAGCPLCGEPVGIGRVVFLIVEEIEAVMSAGGQAAMSLTPASYATGHAVRFEPCGCIWRSAGGTLDLVCSIDRNGFTRFGLATREPDGGDAEIMTETQDRPCEGTCD